jgi:NAD(P)-dependent dehydrogenase (short-subunit alcohol dehydrogenase family)
MTIRTQIAPIGTKKEQATEITEKLRRNEEIRAKLMSMHPIGRFGQSDEVAAAVLYLCSPGATFITGAALPVDGGNLA